MVSKGLGATPGEMGPFTKAGEVNLKTAFLDDNNNFSPSRDDHSGQFNLDNMRRYMYWNVLMKRFGLAPATDFTQNLGGRP